MAVIHHTTLRPTKLELLADWLPSRPWYQGATGTAALAKAGGFRLDDPEGEVGIEFMVVTDGSGHVPVSYQVPLTYRGSPLAGAEAGLVGTLEHGVLGKRWVYDGTHDPVLVEQLLTLLAGRTVAQAQSATATPDPTVEVRSEGAGVPVGLTGPGEVADTTEATVVAVGPAGQDPALTLTVTRVLRPGAAAGQGLRGQVLAGWPAPDGAGERGAFAFLSDAGPRPQGAPDPQVGGPGTPR
ncbi:1,4-alpha-glucan branching protein [Streptomyces sp. AP-93]|uniref:maltokinase N-terminal cap-like domain-containing protein n=1 Tax=Streptomyces sp. AP-93 TaxID=2929048 RepID=UPI001FAECF8C|nr:1,4-alpha-glucan branching protein [Streptomyces sp. AP-93]MCJ0873173.1 1,4-alpha-glucan branching protein [Streptomyces sp. AP-93]